MSAAYVDLTNLAKTMSTAGGAKAEFVVAGLIRGAAYKIQSEAQSLAPRRTGALASSISVTFHGPLSATIGPGVDYGVYQEFGTQGPYTITPRSPGGVLVFDVGGTKVFTRRVTHPGVKAQPYMRPAAKDVVGELTKDIGLAGVNLIVSGEQ